MHISSVMQTQARCLFMGEHLLEISDTAIFNGKLADGIAGVHSTVCLSFDKDKVPSWFLYVTEALSGGLDMMWLLSLKEADREDGSAYPYTRS